MASQAVIFDIGNVLIRWQPEAYYDRVIGPSRREAFFTETDILEMHLGIDAGAPFEETIVAHAKRHPAWHDEIMMWHDDWNALASPAIDHSVRLLAALKRRKVPVFTLTNFGAENFPISQDHYEFLKTFDRYYVSGDLKMIKPDANIYAHVESDCGLAPEALLFADDRQENIDAAAARGWKTHHFMDPQGWADRLIAEGLLEKDDAT
ncbi:HAD family phosphatase [Shimia litoralis]|uniref:HAD family phosphatase n=1 Tax=Shimia litoralis TaxID=420403 RepID=A0A4U7N7W6_9RHOB|nr:HAD family phosphatase [Shimia litoralis]TKZ22015.1 HAD family phosphatase [Shimia litoralis]